MQKHERAQALPDVAGTVNCRAQRGPLGVLPKVKRPKCDHNLLSLHNPVAREGLYTGLNSYCVCHPLQTPQL